ncbi:uncharacterized protein LOC122065399 isoform X2 [Macadamia integrifolia]|uniref:uncharacterized protein LOC122065399 isoform X2 n=1 Tax=Macadamia integrifolia TaxID=60698 RepID=UPI001C4F126E|nr:uncharacterized protein LOC122065399 isoform X2 [Macadamia integrifolia]
MKQHLGHQEKGDAAPCRKVPESVRDQIQNDLNMVSAGKKVKPGNASKKIQDKQYVSRQVDPIQGEGEEDTCLLVKEGNMKADPTGIVELSGLLVGGQHKLIEKATPLEHMNSIFFAASYEMSHANDETLIDNMQEATGAITDLRDQASATITRPQTSTDQASSSKLVPPTFDKQRSEVIENNQDLDNRLSTVDISTNELKSAQERQFGALFVYEATQYENVQGYMIPVSLSHTFDSICSHHGDIFEFCSIKRKDTRSLLIVQMCKIVQQIQATKYENISEAMINEWDEACSDHKALNIYNDWLMSSVKTLEKCFKEKTMAKMVALELEIVKKKIEIEIRKIDMDSAKIDSICNRYGDIFKRCIITRKDTRRLMLDQMCEVIQQIQATTYENISEAKMTEWYEVCFDHNSVKIKNEWLMSSVKELINCFEGKIAVETKILKLQNSVKEKIESEIRKIDLMMDPSYSKWRKRADEDVDAVKNPVAHHDRFIVNDMDGSASKQIFNMRENDGELSVHIGDYYATQVELYTLEDQNWIGSPVVNIFGQMLILKQKKLDGVISRHYFPTYFGEKIAKGVEDLECFYSVKNLDYNLTRCELDTCERILTLLNEGRILSISKWSQDRPQLPLQTNLNDCGVFMLKFMECWNGELTENFSQDDIVFIRKKILEDLMLFSGNNAKKETSIKY